MQPKTLLQSKHDMLAAELQRRRAGLLAKTSALLAVLSSLFPIYQSAGMKSVVFVGSAVAVAIFLAGIGFNAWAFRRNLQDTKRDLANLA